MSAAFLFASGWGSRPREDEELTPIEDDDEPFVEEEEESRSAISLGWIFHAIMSAKARIGWFLSTAYRSLVSSGPAPRLSFDRHEPNLDGRRAPSLAPQHDDEEPYEEEDEGEGDE